MVGRTWNYPEDIKFGTQEMNTAAQIVENSINCEVICLRPVYLGSLKNHLKDFANSKLFFIIYVFSVAKATLESQMSVRPLVSLLVR